MSKIIAVTSGKGGTGKSTVCAGLGYTLAKQGHRTLLIELDFGLRCLDIMFGMENDIKNDLGDVLSGKKQALDAVSSVPMAANLNILCAPKNLVSVTAQQIYDICSSVKKYFEYIIIDTGAGINSHVFDIVEQANLILVVSTPDLVGFAAHVFRFDFTNFSTIRINRCVLLSFTDNAININVFKNNSWCCIVASIEII